MKRCFPFACLVGLWTAPGAVLAHDVPSDTVAREVGIERVEVVTNARVPSRTDVLPDSVSVVARGEIERSGASSVLDVLRGRVPGLMITERGTTGYGIYTGAGGGISLRGVGGSPMTQVMIAVDGHPQMMGINGHHLPDAYVAYNAERIEVVRGPASMLYGSNAMGGVINIISREAPREGVQTVASARWGSWNTQKYLLSNSFSKRRWSTFVSANYDHTDGHRRYSAFGLFNAYAKVTCRVSDRWRAAADVSVARFRSTDPGPVTRPVPGDTLVARVTRGMSSLSFTNEYGRTSGSIRVYYDFGHHDLYYGWVSDDDSFGVQASQSIRPWRGGLLTLGADYKRYGGRATDASRPVFRLDKHIHETAVYLAVRQDLARERVTLDAGVRADVNSRYGPEWVPQAGVSYRPARGTTLKAVVSKGFRSPTIRELYVAMANDALRPERMIGYEVSWLQSALGGRLRTELALYLSRGSNLIRSVVTAGIPRYYNTGSFTHKGVEASAVYRFGMGLDLSVGYSYLHWREPVLATPRHQLTAAAGFVRKRWTAGLDLQYVRDYYLATGPASRSENFALLGARVACGVARGLEVSVEGRNLLDTGYEMTAGYPMPGATFLAGLRCSF